MKQTILVTGSAGFIGRIVVPRLLADGYKVLAMLRPGAVPPFSPHDSLSLLYADITDYSSFANLVKKVDAIVHLAANKYHPKLSYKVNLSGAKNLVRLIEENKIRGKRIINISSQSTKIRFRGVYGESKRLSDAIIEMPEIEWTTLKPSLVYGEGKETLFSTIKNYVEKLPFVPMIGNGNWELYPIDVEDLARYIVVCLKTPKTIHKVYDLGDTKKITFDNLVYLIERELGIEKRILHVPVWMGLPAVYVATKLIPTLPITVDNVLGSTQNTRCNPKKAVKDLKIKPLAIEKGVHKYLSAKRTGGVKMAIVGLGKMGIMHAGMLNVMPNVNIVAIVDRDESLGTTAQSMGIKAEFYTSLELALQQKRIDAVYICTPTFAHKEVILTCEKHHLPYFVEKPVFPRYADYKEIKVDKQNMAGYFWLYKREVEYTKKLLEYGTIGKIRNYTVTLKHSEVFGPKKGWLFKKKLSGGGVLANPGPHALSLAQYLFGAATVQDAGVRHIHGNEVEDAAAVKLLHQHDIQGTITANWSVQGYPVMTIEFSIRGERGAITFTKNMLSIAVGGKSRRLTYEAIPQNHEVFNLNPRGGGDAYYRESEAFVKSLSGKQTFANNVIFASAVEKIISEAYAKADK